MAKRKGQWVRIYHDVINSDKLDSVSDAAVACWLRCIVFSATQKSDGYLAKRAAQRCSGESNPADIVQELVDANLLEVDGRGLRVHGYSECQETREEIEASQEKARAKKARQRAKKIEDPACPPNVPGGQKTRVPRGTKVDVPDHILDVDVEKNFSLSSSRAHAGDPQGMVTPMPAEPSGYDAVDLERLASHWGWPFVPKPAHVKRVRDGAPWTADEVEYARKATEGASGRPNIGLFVCKLEGSRQGVSEKAVPKRANGKRGSKLVEGTRLAVQMMQSIDAEGGMS